jgi:hypothetical protein
LVLRTVSELSVPCAPLQACCAPSWAMSATATSTSAHHSTPWTPWRSDCIHIHIHIQHTCTHTHTLHTAHSKRACSASNPPPSSLLSPPYLRSGDAHGDLERPHRGARAGLWRHLQRGAWRGGGQGVSRRRGAGRGRSLLCSPTQFPPSHTRTHSPTYALSHLRTPPLPHHLSSLHPAVHPHAPARMRSRSCGASSVPWIPPPS